MITVHLIFNAHIDPIWQWPWQSGMDETLATCRTACDLLDEYPQLVFTKGEAWGYRIIEEVDPELFARMKKHIENRRLEPVGGWWIQPDCNQPSGFALEKQIEVGKDYLLRHIGRFPNVAYNVDSFGHTAALPRLMKEAGQDFYIMMRPQEHEMRLPARLFRWRGYENGPEVVTFRIARAYTAYNISADHIMASVTDLPQGVEDTMCFVGVGDHGGGVTEKQIRWCMEHAQAFDGIRLEFSSPARFFKAISEKIPSLPLVTGELQHHAVGCYSVNRPIKTAVRETEHMLKQAEIAQGVMAARGIANRFTDAERLNECWQRVCFGHFHDTLGGTSILSAYPQVLAQLGEARAYADDTLQIGLRAMTQQLPDDPMQRLVLFNASDLPYSGYVEVEPWFEYNRFEQGWRLLDESDAEIALQIMYGESAMGWISRLVFRIDVPAGEMRVLRIDTGRSLPNVSPAATVLCGGDSAASGSVKLDLGGNGFFNFGEDCTLPLPQLTSIPDFTDNWSHSIDRFPMGPGESPVWNRPTLIDAGPLMASYIQTGSVGRSSLKAEWRVYAGETFVELDLKVDWHEEHRIMKMVFNMPDRIVRRVDGVPGGYLERLSSGQERPLRDWTLAALGNGTELGIVCPDVYAIDSSGSQLRLTLLRSPIITHHDPGPVVTPRAIFSDQGEHTFKFRFFGGCDLKPELMDMHSYMLQRPLITADLTKGMKRNARWS